MIHWAIIVAAVLPALWGISVHLSTVEVAAPCQVSLCMWGKAVIGCSESLCGWRLGEAPEVVVLWINFLTVRIRSVQNCAAYVHVSSYV